MKPYTKTIVCVDDDPDDLFMLRQAIQDLETAYTIVEALDGIHALELIQHMNQEGELPCLIVLDINMPRMDGKQTLIALQHDVSLSAIPVVLFSTSSSMVDKNFSKKKSVELITKPLTVEALYSTASKLLSYCRA